MKGRSYYNSKRHEILDIISGLNLAPGFLHLDIGAGYGSFLSEVNNNFKTIPHGVELQEECIPKLTENATFTFQGDCISVLDEIKTKFHLITALDVVEHVDEWQKLLTGIRSHLRDNGFAIFCVPNIQNIRIILDLISGRWTYTSSGILDSTHLRFFTRKSFSFGLETNGFRIIKVFGYPSCIKGSISSKISQITLGMLDDFISSRYIFVCGKLP